MTTMSRLWRYDALRRYVASANPRGVGGCQFFGGMVINLHVVARTGSVLLLAGGVPRPAVLSQMLGSAVPGLPEQVRVFAAAHRPRRPSDGGLMGQRWPTSQRSFAVGGEPVHTPLRPLEPAINVPQ